MQRYLKFSDRSLRSTARLLAYYSQRLLISRRLRRLLTSVVIDVLSCTRPAGRRAHGRSALTRSFHIEGYVPLDQVLSQEQCDDIHRYLKDKILYEKGVARGTCTVPIGADLIQLGDYSLETVVHCPHVMDLANRPDFLDLATEYLGFTPTISNLSLRWSFPSTTGTVDDVQTFHRDSEVGSFKILVYLTDVDLTSGPHVYLTRSHNDRISLRLRFYSEEEISRYEKELITVIGPAGTGFAIDTRGIHKGAPPMARPRLILGIQYSLLSCPLYDYSPVNVKSATGLDMYINRLIVRPILQ